MKGPTSFPDGEMTPNIPMNSMNQKFEFSANTKPVAMLRDPPISRVMRRPNLSARDVKKREMAASPNRLQQKNKSDYFKTIQSTKTKYYYA